MNSRMSGDGDKGSHRKKSVDEIETADGNFTIEAPTAGTTVEAPPDGGLRAWLIVLACAVINLFWGAQAMLLQLSFVGNDMATAIDIEQEDMTQVYLVYSQLSNTFAPIAAVFIMLYGYRATVIGGTVSAACVFLVVSHLKDEAQHFFKFCVYIPAAIGSSCITLGTLLPVLEYFTTQRMKALMVVRIAKYAGALFAIPILINNFNWRHSLRVVSLLYLPMAVTGLSLKELKLTMKNDENVSFRQRALGLVDKSLMKNPMLWCIIGVFFLFQMGIDPIGGLLDGEVLGELNLDIGKTVAYVFMVFIGQILGAVIAWLLKRVNVYPEEARAGFRFILVLIVAISTCFVIPCFIIANVVNFGFYMSVIIIYGLATGYTENVRDDYVPVLFGQQNVRITESLILLAVGLGGVIAVEVTAAIYHWQDTFYFAAAVLILTVTVVTGQLIYFYHIRQEKSTVEPSRDAD